MTYLPRSLNASPFSVVAHVLSINMAKSKDKRRDSENGEKNADKDETVTEQPTLDYDELVKRVCAIARPLAGRKLTKRLYKTVKKGK